MSRISALLVTVAIVLFGFVSVYSQGSGQPVGDWIRVQSDDGEFSVEVPVASIYFFNKDGFPISEIGTSNHFNLGSARILNSFVGDTLISFECFEASKGALNAIYKDEIYKRDDFEKTEIKGAAYTIKQLVRKVKNAYSIRQFFYSRNNIYILTAASRNGETAVMRRFLDSLLFSPNVEQKPIVGARRLSSLHNTDPVFESDLNAKYPEPKVAPDPKAKAENDNNGLILIYKPKPAYTDAARMRAIQGTVVVKTTFSAVGYVSKVVVVRQLSDGLLRQVLFANIRMKFLPALKNDKPETVTKTVEYSFSI